MSHPPVACSRRLLARAVKQYCLYNYGLVPSLQAISVLRVSATKSASKARARARKRHLNMKFLHFAILRNFSKFCSPCTRPWSHSNFRCTNSTELWFCMRGITYKCQVLTQAYRQRFGMTTTKHKLTHPYVPSTRGLFSAPFGSGCKTILLV